MYLNLNALSHQDACRKGTRKFVALMEQNGIDPEVGVRVTRANLLTLTRGLEYWDIEDALSVILKEHFGYDFGYPTKYGVVWDKIYENYNNHRLHDRKSERRCAVKAINIACDAMRLK